MAIEIVDLSIKNGDFPLQNVSLPEGINDYQWWNLRVGLVGLLVKIDRYSSYAYTSYTSG